METLEEALGVIDELNKEIEDLKDEIGDLESDNDDKDSIIRDLKSDNRVLENEVKELRDQLPGRSNMATDDWKSEVFEANKHKFTLEQIEAFMNSDIGVSKERQRIIEMENEILDLKYQLEAAEHGKYGIH